MDSLTDRLLFLEIPVTRQPTGNTCIPACLDMLLEHHSPGRATTRLDFYRLSPSGMNPVDAIGFIDANLEAVGMRLSRGTLPQAIELGQPFIAFVSADAEGHAVVVQGVRDVNGVPHLLVRDPARGAYLERWVDFEPRLVTDRNLVGHPTIWAER